MLSRLSARLLTGPLAFLACGIADLLAYAVRSRQGEHRVSGPGERRLI